jgi:hypothetical protein
MLAHRHSATRSPHQKIQEPNVPCLNIEYFSAAKALDWHLWQAAIQYMDVLRDIIARKCVPNLAGYLFAPVTAQTL